MARRFRAQPPIKMGFWKRDGNLWYADPADLKRAISESGHSDVFLRNRMLAGYCHIQEVIEGKRIDGWAVAFIEWSLSPNVDPMAPMHSAPTGLAKDEG